jgi:undecaprenyl-phosphate galactose phosphotransferase
MTLGFDEEHLEPRIKHIPLKRGFDICFSLAALTLLSPLYLLIPLFIKVTSKGPAIYYQYRIGRGKRPFKCYKFRSMFTDADARLEEILSSDPVKKREWELNHKLKADPRITPIGNFLRKTSLDELPQFWNVLKGDLSVVGPRPVVQEEIERHFKHKADKIFSYRPGITGLWQISGRNDMPYGSRIALDEYYVERRHFFMDLKIIALTIPSMLFKGGAY